MAIGYRGLLAFWSGGAGGVAPTATKGVRSLLAPWIGGAATGSGVSSAGYRGLLAFWAGGAGTTGGSVPLAIVVEQGGHGKRQYENLDIARRRKSAREERELIEIMTALIQGGAL